MIDKLKAVFKKISDKYHKTEISLVEKLAIGLVIFTIIATGTFAGIIVTAIVNQSDIQSLEKYQMTIPTKIYDIHNRLISEVFIEKRDLITYDDLPEDLINAIISAEDTKFFDHPGIDLYGIGRAAFKNLVTLSKSEGASTLTQQVARGVLLSKEKTFIRKIKEVWITFQIEKKYSKEEILTLYFNQIFFGHSVYGVQAASRFYFSKNVEDLTLAEAALIASLPPSPNRYSPVNNPNISMVRQKVVLNRMVSEGFITKEEADNAHAEFWQDFAVNLKGRGSTAFDDTTDHAPYVTEHVRRMLIEKYGKERIQEDGLQVYTTIDLDKQMAAQRVLSEALAKENEEYAKANVIDGRIYERDILDRLDMLSLMFDIPYNIGEKKFKSMVLRKLDDANMESAILMSELFGFGSVADVIKQAMNEADSSSTKRIEGALVSLDPKTGYIISMVGGSRFTPRNQLNRVTQARRQAGSSFKPFLYAYAIHTKRFNSASMIMDAPIAFPMGERYWTPANSSGEFLGSISMKRALRSSVNIVSVRILEALGVGNAIRYIAPIFGADPDNYPQRMFNADFTMALGTGLFSPLEVATAYAVFANQGKEVNPIIVRCVTDRYGVVIDDFEQELQNKIAIAGGQKQVISPQVAYVITDMLQNNSITTVGRAGFRGTYAGKTGTSSDFKDAWFMGYTPDVVTGVWVGFDDFGMSLGRNKFGGNVSAPIWGAYMKEAMEGQPRATFRAPRGIGGATVCAESGMLPSSACWSTMREIFISGAVPISVCTECSGFASDEQYILDSLMEQFGFSNDPFGGTTTEGASE